MRFVEPGEGYLACGWVGKGRLAEPEAIVEAVERIVNAQTSLAGKTVLVTAGPTLEDLDPVRFMGNRSSGRMGFAIAEEAARRGARVTLVAGPTALSLRRPCQKSCECAAPPRCTPPSWPRRLRLMWS